MVAWWHECTAVRLPRVPWPPCKGTGAEIQPVACTAAVVAVRGEEKEDAGPSAIPSQLSFTPRFHHPHSLAPYSLNPAPPYLCPPHPSTTHILSVSCSLQPSANSLHALRNAVHESAKVPLGIRVGRLELFDTAWWILHAIWDGEYVKEWAEKRARVVDRSGSQNKFKNGAGAGQPHGQINCGNRTGKADTTLFAMGDTVNTPTVKHLHRDMSAFQSRGGRNTFPQFLETCRTMQKAGKQARMQAG